MIKHAFTVSCLLTQCFHVFCCTLFSAGGFPWQLTEFIIGVFLQVLGLPFVAVAQVSLFSKVTAERTQGEKQHRLVEKTMHCMLNGIWFCCSFPVAHSGCCIKNLF